MYLIFKLYIPFYDSLFINLKYKNRELDDLRECFNNEVDYMWIDKNLNNGFRKKKTNKFKILSYIYKIKIWLELMDIYKY